MLVIYIFACCLLLENQSFAAGSLQETSPELYPFHAVVDSVYLCSALLISDQFVLCPAHCVNGSTWGAKVFLGYHADAFFQARLWQKDTEAIRSSVITIHDKFMQVSNRPYLNNIALVQLNKPISFRENIRPAVLMAREEFQLLGDVLVNVTGWSTDVVSNLSLAQGRLLNKDVCNVFYQPDFFPYQETCLEWQDKDNRLSLTGNLVSVNRRVLGFTIRPHCHPEDALCIKGNKVITIPPFLDWISRQTNISIQTLTTYKTDQDELVERLDNLMWLLQEVDEQNFNEGRRLARMENVWRRLMDTLKEIQETIDDNFAEVVEP